MAIVLFFFIQFFSWEVFCGLKAVLIGPTWLGCSMSLSCVLPLAGLKGRLSLTGLNRGDSNSEGYSCLPHFQVARAGVPWARASMVP